MLTSCRRLWSPAVVPGGEVCGQEAYILSQLELVMKLVSFFRESFFVVPRGAVVVSLAFGLVACGSEGSTGKDAAVASDAKVSDAKVADAPAAIATEVACAGATITATVTAPGFAYSPNAVSIMRGQTVRFEMPGSHDVNSGGKGFDVGFGATKCFTFSVAGAYTFKCTPHQFSGTITVQ